MVINWSKRKPKSFFDFVGFCRSLYPMLSPPNGNAYREANLGPLILAERQLSTLLTYYADRLDVSTSLTMDRACSNTDCFMNV